MRARCGRPGATGYANYGGRGIAVCERWDSFEAFLADMGPCPPGSSLDRENNEHDYGPGNCRWATRAEQLRNKRTSVIVIFRGESGNAGDFADRLGLKRSNVYHRLRMGYPVEVALNHEPLPVGRAARPPRPGRR